MTSKSLSLLSTLLSFSAVLTFIGDAAPIASLAYETGNFRTIPRFFFTRAKDVGPKTLEFPQKEDDTAGDGILLLSIDSNELKLEYVAGVGSDRGRYIKDLLHIFQNVEGDLSSFVKPRGIRTCSKIIYDPAEFEVGYPMIWGKRHVNLRAKNNPTTGFRLYTTAINFDITSLDFQSGTFGTNLLPYKFTPDAALGLTTVPVTANSLFVQNILRLKVDSGRLVVDRIRDGYSLSNHKDLLHFHLTEEGVDLFKPKGHQPFNKIIYDASVLTVRHPIRRASYVNLMYKDKTFGNKGFRLYKRRRVAISYISKGAQARRKIFLPYLSGTRSNTLGLVPSPTLESFPSLTTTVRYSSNDPAVFCLTPYHTDKYPPLYGLSSATSQRCPPDLLVYPHTSIAEHILHSSKVTFKAGSPRNMVESDILYDTYHGVALHLSVT